MRSLTAVLLLGALAGCAAEGCNCGEVNFERGVYSTTVDVPGTKTETVSNAAEIRRPTAGGTKTQTTTTSTEIRKPAEAGWCVLNMSVPPGRNACMVCC